MEAVEIEISSNPKNLRTLRSVVYDFCKRCGFSGRECEDLTLAVNEAAANIIKHTYKNAQNKAIKMSCDILDDRLKIVLRDFGNRIDTREIKSRKLDDIKPGGLGVHFIKSTMDEVIYDNSLEDGNQLIMIKYLPGKRKDNGNR